MISERHPVEGEELMAFLDGELPAERAVAVGEHVEGCAECKKVVEDLRGVSRRLAAWEVEGCRVPVVEGKVRRGWEWKRPVWVAGLAVAAGVLVWLVVPTWREPQYKLASAYLPQSRAGSRLLTPPASRAQSQGQQGNSYTSALPPLQMRTNVQVTPTLRSEGYAEQTGDITLVMIARTAQLAIVTNDFAHTRERLDAILKSHHGYTGQLTVNAPAGAGRTLEAALKVPSAELEGSLAELKKLGRVESESQSGEEVTQQYVDLEARLNNARNAEQRLTAVLRQRAGKMDDVLAVEKEITRVRGEIEQMEAERKNLGARVEFATINVRITEEYKAQLQGPPSVGTRLGNAAVAGYRNVTGGLLAMAEFALEYGVSVLLWVAVLFWPARIVWRRYRPGAAG